MFLESVKVLSQNQAIRGKVFDVYFTGEGVSEIEILSIEETNDSVDLKDRFSASDLNDVRIAVADVVLRKNLKEKFAHITNEQWNAGFVADAKQNQARGWCNE